MQRNTSNQEYDDRKKHSKLEASQAISGSTENATYQQDKVVAATYEIIQQMKDQMEARLSTTEELMQQLIIQNIKKTWWRINHQEEAMEEVKRVQKRRRKIQSSTAQQMEGQL